jgi:energy-converting hydrogenase Eha subunit F
LGALYDSGLDADGPLIRPRKEPQVGSIVAYKLLPADHPINPNKVWRGTVISFNRGGVLVEMLEPGYERLQEFVQSSQIIAVE